MGKVLFQVLCIVLLFACGSKKSITLNKDIQHLRYITYNLISDEGEKNLKDFWIGMANDGPAQCDTAAYNRLINFDIVQSFKDDFIDTIDIYIHPDTVLISANGGDQFLTSERFLHHKSRKGNVYKIDTLSENTSKVKVHKSLKEKKTIQGISCHQEKFTIEEDPEETLKTGSEHYSAWVTNQITLPNEVVSSEARHFSAFPLFIQYYSDSLKGVDYTIECILIE